MTSDQVNKNCMFSHLDWIDAAPFPDSKHTSGRGRLCLGGSAELAIAGAYISTTSGWLRRPAAPDPANLFPQYILVKAGEKIVLQNQYYPSGNDVT